MLKIEDIINTIICADCMDILPQLPDNSFDLCLCDPPYGITACKWDSVIPFEPMWQQLERIIKPSGAIVLFGSQPFTSALVMSNLDNYKYDWYWQKDRASNHLNAKRQPMRNIETISVFYSKSYYPIMEHWGEPSHSIGKAFGKKHEAITTGDFIEIGGNLKTNIKYPRQLLKYSMPHPRIHPTQKPLALMEYLIKTYTAEGDVVLDFAIGSGTTGMACKKHKRSFIGIELNPEYVKLAEARIGKAVTGVPAKEAKAGQLALFEGDG